MPSLLVKGLLCLARFYSLMKSPNLPAPPFQVPELATTASPLTDPSWAGGSALQMGRWLQDPTLGPHLKQSKN